MKTSTHASSRPSDGFSRSDLIATIAATTLLAGLVLPVVGSTRHRTEQEVCRDNLGALMRATQLYADDHRGEFPAVIHGGEAQAASIIDYRANTYRPWAKGWLTWDSSQQNTNVAYLVDSRYAVLANYTRDAKLYRCPSDTLVHPLQKSRGWTSRVRTYSANAAIGSGNKAASDPIIQAEKLFPKFSDIDRPTPSNLFVFLEENPDSMNDPAFLATQTELRWIDLPASFHPTVGTNRSANFVFADSHVETHTWSASVLADRPDFFFASPTVRTGDPDRAWVLDRMSYNARAVR